MEWKALAQQTSHYQKMTVVVKRGMVGSLAHFEYIYISFVEPILGRVGDRKMSLFPQSPDSVVVRNPARNTVVIREYSLLCGHSSLPLFRPLFVQPSQYASNARSSTPPSALFSIAHGSISFSFLHS